MSLFADATYERLGQLSAGLAARGLDPTDALDGAYRLLGATMKAQSAVLAFRDCYLIILAVFLLLVPLIPLLRRPPDVPASS